MSWTDWERFVRGKQLLLIRPKPLVPAPAGRQATLATLPSDTLVGARIPAIRCSLLDTGVRLEDLAHLKEDRVSPSSADS